jgi:hypothetical protein
MSVKEDKKPLNKIISEVKGKTKYKVFVKDGDSIKTIRFGDSSMRNNRDKKQNREQFMARMKPILADVKGNKKLSKVYWAIRSWKLGTKIS